MSGKFRLFLIVRLFHVRSGKVKLCKFISCYLKLQHLKSFRSVQAWLGKVKADYARLGQDRSG
jgi:hypothetical protein